MAGCSRTHSMVIRLLHRHTDTQMKQLFNTHYSSSGIIRMLETILWHQIINKYCLFCVQIQNNVYGNLHPVNINENAYDNDLQHQQQIGFVARAPR